MLRRNQIHCWRTRARHASRFALDTGRHWRIPSKNNSMPSPINRAISQWDPHQLQQNGKGVIQNVNQDGKEGLQQLADSQRDHNQRHDDQVLNACAARAFRYDPLIADFIVQRLTPGSAAGVEASWILSRSRSEPSRLMLRVSFLGLTVPQTLLVAADEVIE